MPRPPPLPRFFRRDSALEKLRLRGRKPGKVRGERPAEDSDDLYEGLKRAQRSRLEDQRGTEINFELPDFLKVDIKLEVCLGFPYKLNVGASFLSFILNFRARRSTPKWTAFFPKAIIENNFVNIFYYEI